MPILANLTGRRGYASHLQGNQLMDQRKYDLARQKHDRALELYQKAEAQGCNQPRTLMAYAVLMMRYGMYEKARDLMRKVDKSPAMTGKDKQQLRINFAICQWKLGKLDEAIGLLEDISRHITNSLIYGSLGYMYVEQAVRDGNFEKAVSYNQEAYEYDEDDAVVLDNLGQLHLHMGDRQKAMEYFTRAHEKKPYQVDTLYYLALMNHQDGRDEKAREYLETAVNGNFSALATVSRDMIKALLEEVQK